MIFLQILHCTQNFANYKVLEKLKGYNVDVLSLVQFLISFKLLASESWGISGKFLNFRFCFVFDHFPLTFLQFLPYKFKIYQKKTCLIFNTLKLCLKE